MPTTMNANPITAPVNLPSQAIAQNTRRNGKVIRNQSEPTKVTSVKAQAHEFRGSTAWMAAPNGPSARRRTRVAPGREP